VRPPFAASGATRALKPASWFLPFGIVRSPRPWRPEDGGSQLAALADSRRIAPVWLRHLRPLADAFLFCLWESEDFLVFFDGLVDVVEDCEAC
ncbi:hypothetical protein, partial [Paracoccus pantotrophus]|uniref:hypothetical protein n=1 Tax=Paracoccus pantotrophus TaxID=82367 RepID=UPI001C690134